MRLAAKPKFNTAPLDAYATEASRWVAAVLVWLCDAADWVEPLARRSPVLARWLRFCRRRVVRGLRHTVSSLKVYLTCAAFVRLPHVPRCRRPRVRGERNVPRRRFYRAMSARFLRDFHQGSLRERTTRLARLFDELEALTVRVMAHLIELYRAGPIPRVPLARPSNDGAPHSVMLTRACADTS